MNVEWRSKEKASDNSQFSILNSQFSWFWSCLFLLVPVLVQAGTFPATNDPTLSAQQRWGSALGAYAMEAPCVHPTSATTSVSMPACRAYAMDTADPSTLKGFEESTPRTIVYSGGNGTYWLGGRATPSVTPGGWTPVPGTPYAWILSATRPTVSSGLVLLVRVTVDTGAITAVASAAPRRITTPMTLTASLTTTSNAPWVWSGPDAVVTVAAGTVLTLGTCPEAGPYQIFNADGVTTGLVKPIPGACGEVFAEWWGADPSGTVDSTAMWNTTIQAVRGNTATQGIVTIACNGVYAISSTTPNDAIRLEDFVGIVGPVAHIGGGDPFIPCRFNYTGTGTAIGTEDTTPDNHAGMRLENLQIFDVNDTGDYGLRLFNFVGSFINRVVIRRFRLGALFNGDMYYGSVEFLRLLNSRERCAHFTGTINGQRIHAMCHTVALTSTTHGFVVGLSEALGTGGFSNGPELDFQVEMSSGIQVLLTRIRAGDIIIYGEYSGNVADITAVGAVQISHLDGGRLHVTIEGAVTGGPVNIGLRHFAVAEAGIFKHTRNLKITGDIISFFIPYQTQTETGGWGLDLTGLHVENPFNSVDGEFNSGYLMSKSYITSGGIPLVDEGRGSTVEGTNWQVGDLIFNTPDADGRISNALRQVTVAGNPPTVVQLLIPTAASITAIDGDATPSVRIGNTFFTRVEAVASVTAITDFDDFTEGQCIDIRASGNRTITDGASIVLNGSANFAMNAGDMLRLCVDGAVWREDGRGDNN